MISKKTWKYPSIFHNLYEPWNPGNDDQSREMTVNTTQSWKWRSISSPPPPTKLKLNKVTLVQSKTPLTTSLLLCHKKAFWEHRKLPLHYPTVYDIALRRLLSNCSMKSHHHTSPQWLVDVYNPIIIHNYSCDQSIIDNIDRSIID